MKLAIALLAVLFGGMASSAQAQPQFSFLKDFAGWSVVKTPDGVTTVYREERPAGKIVLLPENTTPVETEAQLHSWLDAMKSEVAGKYTQCAQISSKTMRPNGMGFEVQDRETAPKCYLFISATKQQRLFANIRLDDGALDQQSLPIQRSAGVFLQLAIARIQGEAFLKGEEDNPDLAQFISAIPEENIPVQMMAGEAAIKTTNIGALAVPGADVIHSTTASRRLVPFFANMKGNACSDWDPSYFTAETISVTGVKSQWRVHAAMSKKTYIPCKAFQWRQNATNADIEVNMGDGWASLESAMGFKALGPVKAFAKGEKLNVQLGDLKRLSKVVSGEADIRTLKSTDVLFRPDGRFWIGNLDTPTHPLGVYGVHGRYHVDGHIVVLDIADGPVLISFGGKTVNNGEIDQLYLAGWAFGN